MNNATMAQAADEPFAAARPERTERKLASSTPLLLANLVETSVPLLRNIALAHLLPPEQFGLAISLAVVLGLIEVLTDFGLPIFAVRQPESFSSAEALASLHSMALVRSAWLAAILVVLSPLISHVFAAQASFWLYALLGPVALLRGFENLGVKAMMRRYAFGREATVIAVSQTAGLAATIAAAVAGAGMAAMIIGLIATSGMTLLLSHVLSPVPYRLGWQREAVKEAAAFGRPLVINGAAVALTTCDRLLVGAWLGPVALALYNVAYGTATLPRSVLARFLTSAFLPLFVEHRDRGKSLTPLLDVWLLCLSSIAFLYGWGLGLMGDRLLGLVFGATYQPSRLFMCLAGMSVAVKVLMLLPSPVAYADGVTRLITWGSALSALAMLPAALCLYFVRNLELFLFVGMLSELCGLLVLACIAGRAFPFRRSSLVVALVIPFVSLGSLGVAAFLLPGLAFASWLGICLGLLVPVLALYGVVLRLTKASSLLPA
ncbi:oligosaccharide flippase family protein [Labrys neptuniae]